MDAQTRAEIVEDFKLFDIPALLSGGRLPNLRYFFTEPTVGEIVTAMHDVTGIARKDLLGDRHFRRFAWPRQAVMYLARKYTTLSFPQIGKDMGGKCHTTIFHGWKSSESRIKTDPTFAALVRDIERELGL